MRRLGLDLFCSALLLLSSAPAVWGGGLTDVFRQQLGGLELEPIGDALADTVASSYPVASASSSVSYVYNPGLEAFERRTRVLGPIVGERAETIGSGEIDFELTYSYVSFATINGRDLDHLRNRPTINGRVVARPVPEGSVRLADGRFTNFLPIQVHAALDVDAHIISPGVTYGLTPNLDVNITLPLIRASLDAKTVSDIPDPRLPSFALKEMDPNRRTEVLHSSDSDFGVGDLLIRTKYVFHRGAPIDLAAGLGLSLPSGDEEDLRGTGDTRVQPSLIASRTFFDGRLEPLLNLAFDINANDVERTVFRWAIGAAGQIYGPLTGAVIFLGRNELSEQTDKIDAPFFFQIERNDIYDVSLGLRWLLWEKLIVSANVLVPLNDDGLRADAIPTVQLQYVFTVPRQSAGD